MGLPNMMQGLTWNMDYESYANSLPVASGLDLSDKRLIEPFIEAVEERQRALGIFAGHLTVQSGYTCLKNSVYSAINPQLEGGTPSGIIAGFQAQSHIGIDNEITWGGFDQTTENYLNINNQQIFDEPLASGISWSELQQYIVILSEYFVKPYDQSNNNINYDGMGFIIPGSSLISDFIHSIRADGLSNPSGVLALAPSLNTYQISGYTYVNISSRSFQNPYGTYIEYVNRVSSTIPNPSYNPSGSLMLPLDYFSYINDIGTTNRITEAVAQTMVDPFPYPSGFRRKFPHEIWSLSCSGNLGEVARFVFASGYYYNPPQITLVNQDRNLALVTPTWPANWWGDPYGSGFNQLVATPHSERGYSNKLMLYGASGWAVHPDQLQQPDTITRYGLACPGDYFGPWILNDLRDALNQMVWTLCDTPFQAWENNLIYTGKRYCNQVTPSTNLHFSLIDLNGNINNNVLRFSKALSIQYGLDTNGSGFLIGDSSVGASGDPCWTFGQYPFPEVTDSQAEAYFACRWSQPWGSGLLFTFDVYTGNGPYEPSVLAGSTIETSNITQPYGICFAGKDQSVGTFISAANGGPETVKSLAAARSFMYVRPSGANWQDKGHYASGIARQYDFYTVSMMPYSLPVSFDIANINNDHTLNIPNTFNSYGDKMGDTTPLSMNYYQYNPNIGNQLLDQVVDVGVSTKLAGSASGINEDWNVGILIGDKDLTQPTFPSIDKLNGYQLLDIFAIAKWDIPGGFTYTKYA